MFFMDDKENETQPDNKAANKLVVEPSAAQKPRRSVLKEFDPFAPDSPCPPKFKVNNSEVLAAVIDEDEVFEDAETSLTSYVCPRSKNIENSPQMVRTPKSGRESLIIPNLRDSHPEEIQNPNDTVDMSYTEAVENLSQSELDKTSPELDFKQQINPEILVNQLPNATVDIDSNIGLNEDNFMVDSLERTFDGSNPPNPAKENNLSSVVLNKTGPIEIKENSIIVKETLKTESTEYIEFSQIQENDHKDLDSMVDSLESLDPQESVQVVDNTFEKNQYNLLDSLEIVNPEKNSDDLNTEQIILTSKVEDKEPQAQNENRLFENEDSTSESCPTLDKTFEALSTDLGKSETTISLSDKTDASIKTPSELDKAFEALPVDTLETVENVNQITTLHPEDSNDDTYLHKTFEAPASNAVELGNSQMNNDVSGTAAQKEATTKNESLSNTFDLDGGNRLIEENSFTIEDELPKTELGQKKDCESGNGTSLEKTVETLSNTIGILPENQDNKALTTRTDNASSNVFEKVMETIEQETILEKILDTPTNTTDISTSPKNLENKVVTTEETYKICSEVVDKVVENVIKQEPLQSELITTQFITNDSRIVERPSVSLKEIIDIDALVQDVNPKIVGQSISEMHSFPANNLESVNSTFNADEDATESSRVMEALAQSLNQTIDVEESAIVDDVNSSKSPDTSEDLSKEALNVTIENVKDGASTPTDMPEIIENMTTEEHRNNKTLEIKETEEFESLERQYDEKTQNAEDCAKEAINSLEAVINKFGEKQIDTAAEEKFSRVFLRQDTREFEALERECNKGAQNIKEDVEYISINDVQQEKLNKEHINLENETKVIKEPKTIEFENLERECTANLEKPKECPDDLKLKEETTPRSDVYAVESTNRLDTAIKKTVVREETDLSMKLAEVPVKVIVSGNICSASSSVEINNETTINEPFTGIKLKYEQHNAKHESVNDISLTPTGITIKAFNNQSLTKTDEQVEKSATSSVVRNDEVPKSSENISKPRNRPECRPSTRSIRNKAQIIDKPEIINESSKENGENPTSPIPKELAEKEGNPNEAKNKELQIELNRLQTELDLNKTEIKRKDKYILTCALDLEAERDKVIEYKKVVEDYQQTMMKQNEELKKLKEEEERKFNSFTSLEMAFADVFEKYEKAKSVIGQYSRNEEILKRNIECAEEQLTKLEAKCSVTKEQYSDKLKEIEDQMTEEKEKYKHEIAKLQAMVKRLQIKCFSLETAVKQKTEECRKLAELCDDITGNQM